MAAFFTLLIFGLVTFGDASLVTEHWNITSLNTHFMGSNSGFPGGQWPPGSEFSSTIDFSLHHFFEDVQFAVNSSSSVNTTTIPATHDIHCSYVFPGPKSKPTFNWIDCHDNGFQFRFLDRPGMMEANFTLEIVRGGLLYEVPLP